MRSRFPCVLDRSGWGAGGCFLRAPRCRLRSSFPDEIASQDGRPERTKLIFGDDFRDGKKHGNPSSEPPAVDRIVVSSERLEQEGATVLSTDTSARVRVEAHASRVSLFGRVAVLVTAVATGARARRRNRSPFLWRGESPARTKTTSSRACIVEPRGRAAGSRASRHAPSRFRWRA